jgi:hypothetical protein
MESFFGDKDDVGGLEDSFFTFDVDFNAALNQQGWVVKDMLVTRVNVARIFERHEFDPEIADQAELDLWVCH